MIWCVEVVLQHGNDEAESRKFAAFASREDAEAAVGKLREALSKANADEVVSLSAPRRRIDFLNRDFRRARVFSRG